MNRLNSEKIIGIYHNRDLDGFASGAIIKLMYPSAEMFGYDYGQDFPQNIYGKHIIMADISIPMKQMLDLTVLNGNNLTWIDHHISAINDYNEFVVSNGNFCNAILQDGIAACEGTWNHLFPDKKMPLAIKLLGEYDTWRNNDKERWNNEILPFQYGMRFRCNSVDSFPKQLLEDDKLIDTIISEGKIILMYQSQIDTLLCKNSSFELEFNGLRAICLNGGSNSGSFISVYDENKHDIMIPFRYSRNKWVISLYTTKDNIDCSVIAKTYGGGGHKKAAGFQVKDISKIFPNILGYE